MVSVALLGLNFSSYFHTSYQSLHIAAIVQGLTKPIFSGFIIATVGCYFGMSTKGGTQGVDGPPHRRSSSRLCPSSSLTFS